MHLVGVVEIVVGLAILTRWTREASYVAMAWLPLIAFNLLTIGRFLDVAVRDIETDGDQTRLSCSGKKEEGS